MFATAPPVNSHKSRISLLMPMPALAGAHDENARDENVLHDENSVDEDYDNMDSILQVDCNVVATRAYSLRRGFNQTDVKQQE